MRLRRTLAVGAVACAVALVACTERRYECDATVVRCGTFCDTWCDGWGCFPRCYERCWSECIDLAEPSPRGAGAATCEPCRANDDCREGAQCVALAAAEDGGAQSFCAERCDRDGDCPIGTVCRTVGRSALCLPPQGRCP